MLQGILSCFLDCLEFLVKIMPDFNNGNLGSLSAAVNSIYNFLWESSVIIPYSTFFKCIGLIASFYVTLTLYKSITFIIHRIPFIN